MTAAELISLAMEESQSTDKVEITAQAVRNLLRDDPRLSHCFGDLDIDNQIDVLEILRAVISQGMA